MKRLLPVVIILLVLCGCQKKPVEHAPTANLSDAEKKFMTIMHDQNKLDVSVLKAGKTLWIYLPMEEDLVDYHGTHRTDDTKQKKQFVINTFEGNQREKSYRFMFDITDGIRTSKDPGYKSDATEPFVRNRTLVYATINETFADLAKENTPEFFVVIIANIKKGIAYKTIFNGHDYEMYRSEVLPFEEYNLREISELYGDSTLINDKAGKNLDVQPIEWSWFLIEQIKNRVGFKFTRSDFPPDGDIVIQIASIVANTFRYYEYNDFTTVVLKDIRDKKSYQFSKEQLATFHETEDIYKDRTQLIKLNRMQPMQNNTDLPK